LTGGAVARIFLKGGGPLLRRIAGRRMLGGRDMALLTRRSVVGGSLALGAAGMLPRPHIANAAATTVEAWWVQGFAEEEDIAFKKMVADYEKASGNKVEYSLIPYAALRQKAVSAITSGVVPDLIEVADFAFAPLQAWDDKLVDLSDIVEPVKSQFTPTVLQCCYHYNNTTKKRAYYMAPTKIAAIPFHIWISLVEKGGGKIAEIPKTWDKFLDFFRPVQDGLRKAGRRNVYAYGYQLTTTGVDPIVTFNAFTRAYGGTLVSPDGKLQSSDPKVREAAIKAILKLTTPFKDGYVPPGVVNWNDADDNNAFHSKLMVMDFDGTISTEVALFKKKELYDDILTMGLPLDNDGKEIPGQIACFGPLIPKGAKNVAAAKDFVKYELQAKVLSEYLKGGLGRWMLPIPEIAKADSFWLKDDPHRKAYAELALLHSTFPIYEALNPAMAQVGAENVFMNAVMDVMKEGMTPEAALGKAFKRADEIFTKYPIAQS
jgi:multiple sugar transport system substrate-binding protein